MTVRVENGRILVSFGDDDEELVPVEARALANELIDAADECEQQQEQIRKACERGHDMGRWMNSWPHGRKGTSRHCRRDGCTWWEWEAGWMPFAGLPHGTLWGQPLECCGPGCEHCDTKKLGQIIQRMSAEALQRLDAFVFGEEQR